MSGGQDHNGFSHQDPGFLDFVANKRSDIVRIYLPPDANSLLWVADHCLRTFDRINVIVAGQAAFPAMAHGRGGRGPRRSRHRHLGVGPGPMRMGGSPMS